MCGIFLSYFGTVSVFPTHAHIWFVEFQYHSRGRINTRLCTYKLAWQLPRALSMREVITHVSGLNRRTACTIALKDIPETCGLTPSHTSILAIFDQICHSFQRFTTTAGQSSIAVAKTCPSYLNKLAIARGLP